MAETLATEAYRFTCDNNCEVHGLSAHRVVEPAHESAGVLPPDVLDAEQTSTKQPRSFPQSGLLYRHQLFAMVTKPSANKNTKW